MTNLRTLQMAQRYKDHRANNKDTTECVLCSAAPLEVFVYWKVVNNDFPYDRIAQTHHMILPLRHVKEEGLTQEERDELFAIKCDQLQEYDYIQEGTQKTLSIPEHFHLHLIVSGEKETATIVC